jgi:tRNA threonylcarbamoyl adenosine modification protein YeaZ
MYFAQSIRAVAQSMKFLPEILKNCFQMTGFNASQLGGLACVRGPGMFTGIRVVLSIALGLAKGWNIPLAGLDYLPLLASQACRQFRREIWVCTYARKDMHYVQGFASPGLESLAKTQALSSEKAFKLISHQKKRIVLIGSGIRQNTDWWRNRLPNALIPDTIWDHPTCEFLLIQGLQSQYSQDPIRPLYVRPSDAEDNLPRLANQRGLSLEQAKAEIPEY